MTIEQKIKMKPLDEVLDELTMLHAENQKLRNCLAWYADKTNYEHWRNGNPPELMYLKILHGDDGERARRALGEVSGE